ncbi:hypothetical protein FRX31_009408 [Thalictrum thalictroides]|uniref:Uncharacterized protein n=1 Tax=Thalictrum thalictroides TaxID=46969 RepID=A0A7J6WUB2_THATH|nr:hypothetical protein FRX31_009408 [Thalictrum thalictroides]
MNRNMNREIPDILLLMMIAEMIQKKRCTCCICDYVEIANFTITNVGDFYYTGLLEGTLPYNGSTKPINIKNNLERP